MRRTLKSAARKRFAGMPPGLQVVGLAVVYLVRIREGFAEMLADEAGASLSAEAHRRTRMTRRRSAWFCLRITTLDSLLSRARIVSAAPENPSSIHTPRAAVSPLVTGTPAQQGNQINEARRPVRVLVALRQASYAFMYCFQQSLSLMSSALEFPVLLRLLDALEESAFAAPLLRGEGKI